MHERDSVGLERDGQPELAAEVRRAAGDHERAAATTAGRGRDLIGALARLEREHAGGAVDLRGHPRSAAAAGQRRRACGLQLATGTASHERRFGAFGGGLWLPECAYAPGLERELADVGVTVTCVDQTAVHGFGAAEQLEPVLTAAGVVAVPIDWQTVQLVWNGLTGYPATACYRDYHHRTTHDLRPWNIGGGPYRPADAAEQARAHARDFVGRCIERLDAYAAERGRPGPAVLRAGHRAAGPLVVRGPAVAARRCWSRRRAQGLDLTTVSEGVSRIEPVERELRASSWGTSKDFSTWDSPRVADVAFAARDGRAAHGGGRRGRRRGAGRRWGAPPGSCWRSRPATGRSRSPASLSADYPSRRLAGHAAGLDAALGALRDSAAVQPDPSLRNLAPDLDLAPLVAP